MCGTAVDSRKVNVKLAAEDETEDDTFARQTVDDEQRANFKPVLIARRPLVAAESERQQVTVVRQSPRLLQQRQREQDDDEEEQQIAQQVVIRQQPAKPSAQQRGQQLPAQQLLIQQRINKDQPQQHQPKEPPAQTIKNYNKVNDDGSFTFGYEADDGSFKEETRGTDCVVRGKYGYVDPDGNKREFSYVQGNPCDPNAVSAEDEDDDDRAKPGQAPEEENVPANVPRPKSKKNRPTTALFQQTFGDFEQPQQQLQSTTPRQPGRQQQPFQEAAAAPPRRPASQPPRAQTFQVDNRPSSTAAPTLSFRPSAAPDNLESALRNLPQPPPSGKSQLQPVPPTGANSPLYTTELVFDPATGQYNTVIYQQVPKQPTGVNINQRLPLVPPASSRQPQPQFQPHSPPQFQPQPQPQFRTSVQPFQPQFQSQQRPVEFDFQSRPGQFSPSPQQQQLVQQQQALTFQQSQNLFRQQQLQKQQQKQQQPFQQQSTQFFPPPPSQRFAADPSSQFAPLPKPEAHQQQFVLVQPGRTPGQQNLAAGQIDAFLRGHNVQF